MIDLDHFNVTTIVAVIPPEMRYFAAHLKPG